jgi:D-alanyl-lipoteichoic acid acyltransferase DltB (MBOAT superfamily)
LLVAGPIERATHLLPQIKTYRTFNYSQTKEGLSLIVFGLFKKIVIADNCSFFVNDIFKNPQSHSFLELWLGIIFFAFQIYGDFSGYSDIARGVSKLFGIELLHNFKFPYFSKDIADFWRRWHISLSSWFRDYIYIPLGGSKGSKILQIRNVLIIFLISGFWHGANWTFIIWGLIHALLFLPLLIRKKNRLNVLNSEYKLNDLPKIFSTFLIVCIAWVFFRADTLTAAFQYLNGMFNFDDFTVSFFIQNAKYILLTVISITSILFLILLEWNLAKNKLEEFVLSKKIAFLLISMLLFMGVFRNQAMFIYFQF